MNPFASSTARRSHPVLLTVLPRLFFFLRSDRDTVPHLFPPLPLSPSNTFAHLCYSVACNFPLCFLSLFPLGSVEFWTAMPKLPKATVVTQLPSIARSRQSLFLLLSCRGLPLAWSRN
jgi:hypothetical protein